MEEPATAYASAAKPFFGLLTNWNVRAGLAFSFLAMGLTVGGLAEAFTVYLHKNGRWSREDLINIAFNVLVFGVLGMMNSLFGRIRMSSSSEKFVMLKLPS